MSWYHTLSCNHSSKTSSVRLWTHKIHPTGEIWGDYCENFREKWSRCIWHLINPPFVFIIFLGEMHFLIKPAYRDFLYLYVNLQNPDLHYIHTIPSIPSNYIFILDTCLQWIGQKQLQDETGNFLRFVAAYIRYLTVIMGQTIPVNGVFRLISGPASVKSC